MKRMHTMTDAEWAAFLDDLGAHSDALLMAMFRYVMESDTPEDVVLLREHGHVVEDYPGSSGVLVAWAGARGAPDGT